MFPMDRKPAAATVEYDCGGRRVRKTFTDPYQARGFYAGKAKAGARPKVLAVVRRGCA
jgi:hypothetical protein